MSPDNRIVRDSVYFYLAGQGHLGNWTQGHGMIILSNLNMFA